jgi:4-hydroxy-4-methyl-2-oxoglutarate aldolase
MSHSPVSPLSPEKYLKAEELAALRAIPSPTIANAVETFDVRPRNEGYTTMGVRCLFPERGVMLGYACTAMIMSSQVAAPKRLANRTHYWEYTKNAPGPKITVMQDMSAEPAGAYIGEVNANIHLALGSLGILTNGAVRDVPEIGRTGFQVFCRDLAVSHAYAHLEDFNRPVTVFGMTVDPGDLVHADEHGAVVIPHEVAREVVAASRAIDKAERVIIDLCRSSAFSVSELDKLISPDY